MTISFVVATVAIVLFVEALAGAVVLPSITTGQDATVTALDKAETMAKVIARQETAAGKQPGPVAVDPANIATLAALAVPRQAKPAQGGRIDSFALVLDTQGRILASNSAASYPVGQDGGSLLPPDAVALLRRGLPPQNPKLGSAAVADLPGGKAVWALVAIRVPVSAAGPGIVDIQPDDKGGASLGTIGYTYVQAPPVKGYVLPHRLSVAGLLLLLTVPVGVVFGLATTQSLRRRLRRLATASQAVAEGDFTTRVTPGDGDEVGQLERNFNDMTARLDEAKGRELELAAQNARLAERARISRELHDSISQDLFSLALLSGGIERALPADSALQPQVRQLAETVSTAIHEMRSLVLDLHPSALSERGLNAAIESLCASHRARLGVEVTTRLDSTALDPAAEHALFRVAQEAVANAIRHADAGVITVELRSRSERVELTVADDGSGFDPALPGLSSGVGLRVMRERVNELGGHLSVESGPGAGTTVKAVIPVEQQPRDPVQTQLAASPPSPELPSSAPAASGGER
jgi:signal transduction histidine kinase